MGFEVLLKGSNLIRLLQGLLTALKISMISVGISIAAGVVLGSLMALKKPAVTVITRIYLEFVRIMPQMVQIYRS